jgi:outer membrane protein insertion porin family
MRKVFLAVSALVCVSGPLAAQDASTGPCAAPETIDITGNTRADPAVIHSTSGLTAGTQLSARDLSRAIKALYATQNFDDVQIVCRVTPAGKGVLVIELKERPVLAGYTVTGMNRVSDKDVKDILAFPAGSAIDPGQIAKAIGRADSLYESKGYYLARITVDSTVSDGKMRLAFKVDEGRRLAISGIRIEGNKSVSDKDIVSAMTTKPEGFLWTRAGEFDDEKYATDLSQNIPELYSSRGYIDFRILRDTLIVDREKGKALIDIFVDEGPRYTVGTFEVIGNRRFSSEQIAQFYPFTKSATPVTGRAIRIIRRAHINPPNTFDQQRWDDAEQKLVEAYNDEGYIYAQIRPVAERQPSKDSVRTVNLRWEIDERSPAIINRIEIAGNDYTSEACIREQIVLIPGQVFNRNYLIRSYQNIGNLNFFEQPMAAPETKASGDQGDVDVVFNVKEKRTGNVNFGASMGQGTGLGGFIGLDQPNMFGRCKRAQVQWQFGRYINDFNGTYSDPNIKQSRISGALTAYHTRSRYTIADLGEARRVGGQLQLGFPVPNSLYTRLYLSYGGEAVKYSGGGLLGQTTTNGCSNCFRSTLGLTGTHDTRVGLPFATEGGIQSFSAQFNGGPLGGTAAFQRYTTEFRTYAPIGRLGGSVLGGEPMVISVGLSTRAGAIFGNTGPFFYSQAFTLGGTQYGEPLRGYSEFAIGPNGFDPSAEDTQAKRSSFGNAYFITTAELGLRLNQAIYLNTFFEGGNVWDKPREFDPTRLFRSAGFGVSTLSPLGPLGIDVGYGFDKVDLSGNPAPGWKLHFKLGQFF